MGEDYMFELFLPFWDNLYRSSLCFYYRNNYNSTFDNPEWITLIEIPSCLYSIEKRNVVTGNTVNVA